MDKDDLRDDKSYEELIFFCLLHICQKNAWLKYYETQVFIKFCNDLEIKVTKEIPEISEFLYQMHFDSFFFRPFLTIFAETRPLLFLKHILDVFLHGKFSFIC